MLQKIVPNLWFDGVAEEAATYYVSLFDDSRITLLTRYPEGAPGPAGEVMTVEFELEGQKFVAINGGPSFPFTEAVSFLVSCADQAEVDHWWAVLGADGQEGPCGWLKDKYGLSWQVVPEGMDEVFADPDPARAERAMAAMLSMTKLDVAALRDAADGVPAPG
jgi:predicted 3-demethylubiquinone-9 3-methyltransferase (glyoxalase superfamily)